VLDQVCLDLRAGTLTALVGRSGSGKSTLLRVLTGLERPDGGTTLIDGQDLAGLDRTGLAGLRRRLVGLAAQDGALVETLDVGENLALLRHVRGLAAEPELTRSCLVAVDLAGLVDRPVRALSGGERQRLLVARVLAAEPALAVLDEPTSQQDETHAEQVIATLLAARAGAGPVGTGSPGWGSPESGSPRSGSPKSGSPKSGSPGWGSPESGSPGPGSPRSGSAGPAIVVATHDLALAAAADVVVELD